jgi:molecular chaperone HtpG
LHPAFVALCSIWVDIPSDVKAEDYEALYRTLTNDWESQLAHIHFKVEGQIEFTAVLYIPRRAPFDLFQSDKKRQTNLKLYVRRIFVTDDCKDFCPEWLSFIRGLVDSEDLPLNISRESLHVSRILAIMRKNVVKKSIEMMSHLQEDTDRYRTFYSAFSKNVKLGVHEDSANRATLADLLRFYSSKSRSQWTSLKDYISRMPPEQKFIYFLTGDNDQAVAHSPFMEGLNKRGFECLFMTDPIDESHNTTLHIPLPPSVPHSHADWLTADCPSLSLRCVCVVL